MHMCHAPDAPIADTIDFAAFIAVDIRVGEIVTAELLVGARRPSIKLLIDFGPTIGRKRSIAQIAARYTPEMLTGKRVLAVMNFSPRQIGASMSDVLTVGVPDANGDVVLVSPDIAVPLGGRLF